jgi:hypothetical protein
MPESTLAIDKIGIRNYALVTAAYWGFTVTDGALRMLVLLYFHTLGYTPLEVAMLFLFYEIFGIVTNFSGGLGGDPSLGSSSPSMAALPCKSGHC